MIKFYNTKMMEQSASDGGSDTPGKGTYAYDKMEIEAAKSHLPTDPDPAFVWKTQANVITYFESDHPVETEEPDAEKQIIYNHDYILEVDPSEDALIRESKELLDAESRAGVAQSVEPPEEPTTDPDDPGTSQNV